MWDEMLIYMKQYVEDPSNNVKETFFFLLDLVVEYNFQPMCNQGDPNSLTFALPQVLECHRQQGLDYLPKKFDTTPYDIITSLADKIGNYLNICLKKDMQITLPLKSGEFSLMNTIWDLHLKAPRLVGWMTTTC